MGHTHAVYILLQINLAAVGRVLRSNARFAAVTVLNAAAGRAVRTVLGLGVACVYVHLDDFGIATSTEVATAAVAKAATSATTCSTSIGSAPAYLLFKAGTNSS